MVTVIGLLPKKKNMAKTIGAAASIISQPILLPKIGPQLLRVWRPYGAVKKNNEIKIMNASMKQLRIK
ncbi:hypothetical protein ACFLYI_00575 [Chloroflexota bacterium]